MNRLKLSLIILLLLAPLSAWTKTVTGSVVSSRDGSPIPSAYISLFRGDSILYTCQSDMAGEFQLVIAGSVPVTVTATALGFGDAETTFIPDTMRYQLRIVLDEATISAELDELTVTADQSRVVRRTANGQVFYLSKEAKKEHNPFIALAEIPLLTSDFSTSSVKLLNGKQPLVLIDGNQVNSGIAPILPEDIESVEVVTSVPARYLQDGYSGIVNIRLRKNRPPYIWFGASGNLSFPSILSGPGINFEVGKEKFSVYGSVLYSYTRHAVTLSDVERGNTGYSQSFSSKSRASSDRWSGWLLAKYMPTRKDYLAASLRYSDTRSRTFSEAHGIYTTEATNSYASDGTDSDKGDVLSASLYYRHAFADYHDLELTASINTNSNRLDSRNRESIGDVPSEYESLFHNERTSGSFKADYCKTFGNGMSLAMGNHVSLNNDKIDQRLPETPLFRHRKLNEYLYGSLGGSLGKLAYSLSAGMEAIWLRAGDADNSYVRPRISMSATWLFNPMNSLQVSYQLSNESPSIAMLNPRNTSTDPLLWSSGNPFLKPVSDRNLTLRYTFNRSGWYVQPFMSLYRAHDLITTWGYTEDGVYHSTFRNMGRFSSLNPYLTVGYNSPWCSITAVGGWTGEYFERQSCKGAFRSSLNIFLRIRKIYVIADLQYTTRAYGENSVVRKYTPTDTRLHISYNFSPDFYIAAGIYNFTGNVRSLTELAQGSFHSVAHTIDKGQGRGFMPYIRIYYNFRKNNSRKIKFNNPDIGSESGISLKK